MLRGLAAIEGAGAAGAPGGATLTIDRALMQAIAAEIDSTRSATSERNAATLADRVVRNGAVDAERAEFAKGDRTILVTAREAKWLAEGGEGPSSAVAELVDAYRPAVRLDEYAGTRPTGRVLEGDAAIARLAETFNKGDYRSLRIDAAAALATKPAIADLPDATLQRRIQAVRDNEARKRAFERSRSPDRGPDHGPGKPDRGPDR